MAEITRLHTDQTSDLGQILQEAPHRWFRTPEICEILSNYAEYYVTPAPPILPPAGSLFLFDRKVLRYFRKDGHNWSKKKDGKTVKEAHEKLKVGGVDALHCYYAHGEDDEKFQRRIYWMLDVKFDHIVLVHYREVNEGSKVGICNSLNAIDPLSHIGSPKACSASWSGRSLSPVQASYSSNCHTVDRHTLGLPSEFGDWVSGNPRAASVVHPTQSSVADENFLPKDNETGPIHLPKNNSVSGSSGGSHILVTSSVWADILLPSQKHNFDQLNTSDLLSQKLIDARLDIDNVLLNVSSSRDGNTQHAVRIYGGSGAGPESSSPVAGKVGDETGDLKKLDSFGRWMDREIGGDCADPLMASDSTNYWNTLDAANDDRVLSLSSHTQLNTYSIGPSQSQEKLFSISDFAPNWAYSGIETKVQIIVTFPGGKKAPDGHKWFCTFGEIEVPCEVVSDNVIRCQVPFHAPGHLSFVVTLGNRVACSEVREFEYRKNTLKTVLHFATEIAQEEVCIQIRLAKMLYSGLERKWLYCSGIECEKCKIKSKISSLQSDIGRHSTDIEDLLLEAGCRNFKDKAMQVLLKDKLYEWLVCQAHNEDKGPHFLDDEGQGIIHLTASVGYEWAFGPIIDAGVSPNFRDKRGRTSLHWASYYGREEAVITLIKLGVAVGAVDDPRPESPWGQTAADLASARGHKGIAGYLAEADLIGHPLSLSINEEAGNVVPTVTEKVVLINGEVDEDYSLKRSLSAIRKSTHAAAMIQAAFRARSFHHRQLMSHSNDVSLDFVALGSLKKIQTVGNFDDYLHSAIKIQQKYRGWKRRKDFLRRRTRIVKLQARVRGRQVHKQYKKVMWSVSVVEKAILRWRRKKPGLRGIQNGETSGSAESNIAKNDEYDYLRMARKQKIAGVDRALAKVQSLVRHPEARDQYMRLVMKFENFKLRNGKSS